MDISGIRRRSRASRQSKGSRSNSYSGRFEINHDELQKKYGRPASENLNPQVRLYYAATQNKLDEVRMILEAQMADVDSRNAENATPLHGAAYEGNEDVVRLLIEYGASLNATDDDTWTALHAAVCGQKVDCVRVLIDAGCDVHSETKDGLTAFQMSIELKNEELIRLFINALAENSHRN